MGALFACNVMPRMALGFANPNHAAALICAVLPFCWAWRRAQRVGWALGAALVVALMATQSRTGLLVAGAEVVAWCLFVRYDSRFQISDFRSCVSDFKQKLIATGIVAFAVVACWWLWPRMALDGSILNRPRIWLAGLRLFAANPDGVGLGNSGAVASAFLLDGIPEVRTMISTHITLLAEFGWIVREGLTPVNMSQ